MCLESHGAVCEWDGDNLTAWVSTQGISAAREGFASGLGIPQANVRVITQYMGGGFGSKMAPDAQGLICARLAKEAKAPVKLMLDRKEEHLATGNRPSAAARIKAASPPTACSRRSTAESWGTGGAGAAAGFPLPYIYQFPNRRRTHKDVYINTGQQRPMRAPGHPQGSFITEVMMEELADRVKMDPVEFRIKNLPPEAPNAMWGSYLKRGATEFGWDKRHPTGDSTPGPIKTGMGVAINTWGGGGRGSQAHCEISSDGIVVVRIGTQDLGTGTRTMVAVIAADTLGLPAERDPAGDRRHDVPDQRRLRRQHDGGRRQSGDPHRDGQRARRAQREGRAGARRRSRPRSSRRTDGFTSRTIRRRASSWADACKHIGTQPIAVDGDVAARPVLGHDVGRAVRRGRLSTSRPASSRSSECSSFRTAV